MHGFDWSYSIPLIMIVTSIWVGIGYVRAAISYSKRMENGEEKDISEKEEIDE